MAFFKSKIVIAAAIVAALVGLYALAGFKLAPKLVRSQAIEFVQTTYGRKLEIGVVRVQPFKLQIEVRDLVFPDDDGAMMLGFERLFADFELSSLWKRAWYFRDVELDAPLVRTVVRPQGALNLGDLAIEQRPAAPPPEPEEAEPLPSVWIARLGIDRGTVDFIDRARSRPFERHFSPVAFELREFRTTPEGGDFRLTAQSEAAEKFAWKGRFALAPAISSAGDITIDDLRATGVGEFLGDALPFQLSAGLIDLNGRYTFRLGETTELDLELPAIQVADLALRARGVAEDWVRIPVLVVADTRTRLPQQTVAIGKVELTNLAAQAWRGADGSISITRLFEPTQESAASGSAADGVAGPSTSGADDSTAESASPSSDSPSSDGATAPAPVAEARDTSREWDVQIAAIAVNDATIDFEDRSLKPAFKTVLAPTALTAGPVSLDLSRPVPVQVTTHIDGRATTLTAKGDVVPEPLTAALDVELKGLELKRLQPYVAGTTDLTIRSGQASSKGRFEMHPAGGKDPELSYAGDATVSALRTMDNHLEEDFFNVERLEARKLRFALAPDSLTIDRVLVSKPFARVINSSDQVLNVAAVLDPVGTAAALKARKEEAARAASEGAEKTEGERGPKKPPKKAAKKKEPTTPAVPPPALVETGMPILIREVRVDAGRMDFADYFIEPNFAADIRALEGVVTGVSSNPNAHAKIALEGKVGEFSPVTISGEIQPFAYDRFTDVALKFQNISLPVFNPYSGRFAGYNIAKGLLTTELQYRIVDRKLDAKHHIRIDQLEWGEATASKEAVPLPIKFATSLLKDVNGVIDLDVPVTGTLDDPSFRIGPIIWKIIKNILVKAVTAPFRWLGSMFEGAEDAQFVEFAAGDATLDPGAAEKLGTLAKGLAQKPELKLDIPIGTVTELDRPALIERRYELEREAAMKRVLKKKAMRDGVLVPFETLEPDDQSAVLEDLVSQLRGAPPKLPEPPPRAEGQSRQDAKAAAIQAAIVYLQTEGKQAITVGEGDIDALSQARATAVQGALLAPGELDPGRVFMARSDKVTAQNGKVRLELSLK
jgi:outer membrane protein OmpA-like peptidoglycan-associated protein